MKITVKAGPGLPKRIALLAVPVYEGKRGGNVDSAWANAVPKELLAVLRSGDFPGKLGSRHIVHPHRAAPAERVMLVGLGARTDVDAEALRRFGAAVARRAREVAGTTAVLLLPSAGRRLDVAGRTRQCVEGVALGTYRFDRYQSKRNVSPTPIRQLQVITGDPGETAVARGAASEAEDLCHGINLARDLGNIPANDLGPVELAYQARQEGRAAGLKVQVLDEKAMAREGMGALLGVAQGSARPPRLIVMEHRPKRSDGRPPLVLVGKAITFDTGGISIKPTAGMGDMKFDMCGGAAVLGALSAIGRLQLKRRVIGVIAGAENMPDGKAYRPGDVLTSAAGITIEVVSTDAEGRLALADALHFSQRFRPGLMIDVATLTGACVVALGNEHTGAFSTDAKLSRKIADIAAEAGEAFWPLPVEDEHFELVKSTVADLKNSGGRWGGAITAAAFLSKFTGDRPWVHLDIAGTATSRKDSDLGPPGATGVAVRTLVRLAETAGL